MYCPLWIQVDKISYVLELPYKMNLNKYTNFLSRKSNKT